MFILMLYVIVNVVYGCEDIELMPQYGANITQME